jgi:DNA-binding CsgD family transcriptional regulator
VGRAAAEPFALSYALTASVITLAGRWPAEANRLAAEAVDAAVAVRDWLAFVHAVVWESNAHREPYGPTAAADVGRRREQLLALGGPDPHLAQLATVEAEMRLELGQPNACERLLRETLVSDPGPMVDVCSRSIAARLAVYQGRVADALGLLSRVDDLVGGQPRYRGVSLDVTRVYVLIAAGRPAEAYAVALAAATDPGVPVHMAEYLVPQAARALADQVERARDHHEPDEEPRLLLKDLHDRFPTVIDPEDSCSTLWNQRIAALQEWYDAETARAHRDPDEAARWVATRSAAIAGLLPWLELYAGSRGAEAILRRGRTGRPQGVRLLRDSHELAGRLGAEGQQAEIEELARQVRVDLGADRAAVKTDAPELSTLTPRERELLSHLTAGLTYAEIAEVLVISEKTVSSHVSNLLRKTGTTSRVELARLVARITR